MRIRTLISTAVVGLVAFATLAATPASAGTYKGCPYPNVCFYKSKTTNWDVNKPSAKYKDITTTWQRLTRSKGSYAAWNTRNDDIAFFHFTNGKTWCLTPNTGLIFNSWVVDAILIESASTCPGLAARSTADDAAVGAPMVLTS